MRISTTKPLFAWDVLQDSPGIETIRQFLEAVPDAALLESLRRWRGRGRDDYPIQALWGTLLLTIVLRHTTIDACLGELARNPALRELIGIESVDKVPKKWNMSRFIDGLGRQPHLSLLHDVFDRMIQRLGSVVKDLGRHTAGDASALHARGGRRKQGNSNPDQLPEANGGRKEYTDDQGAVTRAFEWFGYKFHLLVDTRHEVALSYQISSANTADSQMLPDLVADAQSNLPTDRIKTLAYDKAADNVNTHKLLHKAEIKPVIQNRQLWRDELERPLAGNAGVAKLVHDEQGTVYCYDMVSSPPVRHRMAYIGLEKSRGTLKYRCPAMHERWPCPNSRKCNAGKKYGLTARVKQQTDLRRFPPIPRATKQFERLYKGRTAVERVNARLKLFWGADDGNVTGPTRFHGYMGAVMVVHAGLATLLAGAPRREGTLGKVNLTPIGKALRAKLAS